MNTTLRTVAGASALAVLLQASPALANDPWELFAPGDDSCASTNGELVHGAVQVHDLEGTGPFDADWMRVQQRAYRSYEARLLNSNLRLAEVMMPLLLRCSDVLQAGLPYENVARDAVSVRWLSTGDEDVFVRTSPGMPIGGGSRYEVQLLETTYAVPRFNNSATQQTVLLVQNTRLEQVNGQVHFFNAGGTLLHSQPFQLEGRGLLVLNTAGISPVAGQSGSLLVAHNAGYGALSGKAVALEPATGFTFDTLFTPKPY
jgi:hypothetical protein